MNIFFYVLLILVGFHLNKAILFLSAYYSGPSVVKFRKHTLYIIDERYLNNQEKLEYLSLIIRATQRFNNEQKEPT